MLPLALYLLALGGYLIARQQDVRGLPDLSTLALCEISVLALAFAVIFRVMLNGRQERGLLLIGVWVWITAGMLFVLVYGINRHPDAREWWPLLLWSLGVTFVLVYPVERTHDTRLIWLGMMTLVAGVAAYGITSDRIDRQSLSDAADYWPLLVSMVGVGLLPLAFRRRLGP
jgi:nicotinamide riboside transporter PnuC